MSTTEQSEITAELDALIEGVPGDEPLEGTRFVNSAAEMLDATRVIERTIERSGGTLYVGFQDAKRLDDEREVYRDLVASDVTVVGFGVGEPAEHLDGVTWREVPRDRLALHNQWFLISTGDEPIAFVGYETSRDEVYRQGPAGNKERTWRGFVTDERRMINRTIDVLEASVRHPEQRVERWYLVATRDGDDPRYDATLAAGLDAASQDGAGVILYDRTTESYLTSPYPRGPWSDEADALSAAWRLTPDRLESLGRGYLAGQLRRVHRGGVMAVAHLAEDTGRTAMAGAVERYDPTAVFLPAHLDNPSLLDRVRGNTVAGLTRGLDVPVHVVDESGSVDVRKAGAAATS